MDKIYDQMRQLNKYARDIMVKYEVHSCTDVTGFGLLGHGYEMAQGSDVTIHFIDRRDSISQRSSFYGRPWNDPGRCL